MSYRPSTGLSSLEWDTRRLIDYMETRLCRVNEQYAEGAITSSEYDKRADPIRNSLASLYRDLQEIREDEEPLVTLTERLGVTERAERAARASKSLPAKHSLENLLLDEDIDDVFDFNNPRRKSYRVFRPTKKQALDAVKKAGYLRISAVGPETATKYLHEYGAKKPERVPVYAFITYDPHYDAMGRVHVFGVQRLLGRDADEGTLLHEMVAFYPYAR